MNRSSSAVILLCALAGVAGCDRRELAGPPTLRLGRDQCAECGMLISEERCSSAVLFERDGRREYAMFDDIGCMLDHETTEAPDRTTIDAFVRDHSTAQWVPAANAVFLVNARELVRTPMGSGMIAFADRDGALEAQQQWGGDLTDYARLIGARAAK